MVSGEGGKWGGEAKRAPRLQSIVFYSIFELSQTVRRETKNKIGVLSQTVRRETKSFWGCLFVYLGVFSRSAQGYRNIRVQEHKNMEHDNTWVEKSGQLNCCLSCFPTRVIFYLNGFDLNYLCWMVLFVFESMRFDSIRFDVSSIRFDSICFDSVWIHLIEFKNIYVSWFESIWVDFGPIISYCCRCGFIL